MIKITGANQLKIGELKSFQVFGERIAVHRKSAELFFTFEDECTHDGAPICEGETEDEVIVCPRHGARFSMKDGSVKSMPATSPIEVYPNQYRDGDLYVELDS